MFHFVAVDFNRQQNDVNSFWSSIGTTDRINESSPMALRNII
ncbi:MAG: hypothetical protein ACOVO2_00465 [Emticicia sp.]